MKTVYFVSSNAGKIEEVTKHLKNFGIEVIGRELELIEINSEDQEQISKAKALEACKAISQPSIVEDTGIYFSAYKKFPGTHSKFVYNSIGYDGILKLLEGKDRNANFITTVSYCEPNSEPKSFVGFCKGKIIDEVRCEPHPRLPYDGIFIPNGDTRTFAEMTKEEKAKYSHRAKALEAFANWFVKI